MPDSFFFAFSDSVVGLVSFLVQAAGDAAGDLADGVGQAAENAAGGELGTAEDLGGNFDPLTGEPVVDAPANGPGDAAVGDGAGAGPGDAANGAGGQPPGFLESLLANPLLLFGGLMLLLYVVVLSPERRKQAEITKKRAALKKNDRVVTTGGILGTVVSVSADSDEVTLRVDETTNTRIRVLKSAIGSVLDSGKGKPDTSS